MLHLIDTISDAEDLTIYVGAGLTIDMGGPNWTTLVRRAGSREEFRSRKILSDKGLGVLTSELTPLEAATAVAGYYLKQSGGGPDAQVRARASFVTAIRSHLYPDGLWNSGRLTKAVAELVLVRALWGQKTRILTTNYDCFLEDEIRRIVELGTDLVAATSEVFAAGFATPTLRRRTLTDDIDFTDGSLIEVIYLHGRIDQDPQLPVEGHLAITEIDYGQIRPDVVRRLSEVFSVSCLLTLGASLTDPPLLSALQETRSESGSRCRAGVLPVAAMLATCDRSLDDEETRALIAHHDTRMGEFGVSLLAPDSFAQVAQLCIELTAAAQFFTLNEYPYSTDPDVRYGNRLKAWWDGWHSGSFQHSRFRRSVHRYLIHTVRRVREEFNLQGTSRDEVLKLEVWARWSPSTTHRRLKLFASSAALWEDPEVMRYADISLMSDYKAVQALINGKPMISRESNDAVSQPEDNPDASRWRTYLSVPIDVAINGLSLTVGVVVLASMSADPDTGINETDAARLEKITDWMRILGANTLR